MTNKFSRTKTSASEKSAWRVVADPSADEKQWMAACTALGDRSITAPTAANASTPSWIKSLAATAIAFAVGLGGMYFVHLQLDWGYQAVLQLVGQPGNDDQGTTALYALIYIASAIFFGFALGTLKNWFATPKRLLLIQLAAVMSAPFLMFEWTFDKEKIFSWQAMFEFYWRIDSLWLLAGLAAMLLCTKFGSRLSDCLRAHLKPRVAIVPFMIAMLTALLHIHDSGHSMELELIYGSCMLFLVGFVGALWSRLKSFSTTASIALSALAPLTVCNLINLFGNIFNMGLNLVGTGLSLGWHALLSAVLICIATYGCTMGGAWTGWLLNKYLPREDAGKNEVMSLS